MAALLAVASMPLAASIAAVEVSRSLMAGMPGVTLAPSTDDVVLDQRLEASHAH